MNYKLTNFPNLNYTFPLLSLSLKSPDFSPLPLKSSVFLLKRKSRTPFFQVSSMCSETPYHFTRFQKNSHDFPQGTVLIDLAIFLGMMGYSLLFIYSFSIVKLILTTNLAVSGNGTLSFLHHVLNTLENPTH